MKKWVMFIIKINSKLSALCDREDRVIQNIALCFSSKTDSAYEQVLLHSDKKIRFVNLNVMLDWLCQNLPKKMLELLMMYSRGEPIDNLCQHFSVSRATIFRNLDKCFDKCQRLLKALGYDDGRMQADYGDIYERLHNGCL